MELSGKTALVTGAGRGIGAAIAKKLADKGATVIINYSGNDKAAQDTLDDIAADGNKAEIYKCNVADYEEVEQMIQYVVQKYKKIDILINNAGITRDGLIMRMSEKDFDSIHTILVSEWRQMYQPSSLPSLRCWFLNRNNAGDGKSISPW